MRTLCALLAATVVGACAGTAADTARNGDDPVPDPRRDPSIISEVGSARDRARAHTNLAAAYYEAGNMGVALEEIRVALNADPGFAPAHSVQGLLHMEMREVSMADASFQRALQISPNDPDSNHNYGWFLCQTGREEQGVRYFLSAVRNPLYATPEKSYTQAGICALRAKDEREGIENLERALRLQPNYPAAMLPLAQARYRRGDIGIAKTLVGQLNRLAEPGAEALWLALRIERKLGDKGAESGYAEQLRRRFPGSPEYQSLQKGAYE
jgi:type IV pilus assembly protein PilF